MLPGAARRKAWSACGVTCSRRSSRLAAEAAGGQDQRDVRRPLEKRLPEPHPTRGLHQRGGQALGVEAGARGQRVARLARQHGRAQRLQPGEVVVESLEQQALEALVTVRALLAEPLEVAVAPDHSA